MKRRTLEALREARLAGRPVVRALDLSSGEERLLDPGCKDSPLEGAAADASRADRSSMVEVERRSWFLEVHNPPLDLKIVGAVHIAQPLARIAALAGYQVSIIDPRSSFATADRFPEVELLHEWPDDALAKSPPGARSALVALTHDPKLDDPALAAALRTNCFYIGALGSKKTHAVRLVRLGKLGFTDEELSRIHGPIGLAIQARTPAEIAISILAEMTMRLRADDGWERSVIRATANTGITPRS